MMSRFVEDINLLTEHIHRRHSTWSGFFSKFNETSVYNSTASEFSDIVGSDFKGDDFDESSLNCNTTLVDTNVIELQPNRLQQEGCDENTTDLDEFKNIGKLNIVLEELQKVTCKENIDPSNVKALPKIKYKARIKKNKTKLSSYKNVRCKWSERLNKLVKKSQFSSNTNENASDVTSIAPQKDLLEGNSECMHNSPEKLINEYTRISMTSTSEEINECFNINCEPSTSSLLNKVCQVFDKPSKDVCFRDISNLVNSTPLASKNIKKFSRNSCEDLTTIKLHNELNFELNSSTSVITSKNNEQKKMKNSTSLSKISPTHGSNLNTTITLKSTQIFNNGKIPEVYSEEYLKAHNITDVLDVDFDPDFDLNSIDSSKNANFLSYPKTNSITYLEDVLETSQQNDNLNSTSGNTCAPNINPIIYLVDVLSTNWQNEYSLRRNPKASLPSCKNIVLNKMNENKGDKNKNTQELHTNDNLCDYSQDVNTIGTIDNSYLFASLPPSDRQLVLEKYKDKIEELYSEKYMHEHNITDVLDIDEEFEISQMILQDNIHDQLQVTNCSSNIHLESTVYEKDTHMKKLNSSSIEVTNRSDTTECDKNRSDESGSNESGPDKSVSNESESDVSLPGVAKPDTKGPSTNVSFASGSDVSNFIAMGSGAIDSPPSTRKISGKENKRNEGRISYSYNTRASTAGQSNNVFMVTDVNASNMKSSAEISSDISKQHKQTNQSSVGFWKVEATKSDTKVSPVKSSTNKSVDRINKNELSASKPLFTNTNKRKISDHLEDKNETNKFVCYSDITVEDNLIDFLKEINVDMYRHKITKEYIVNVSKNDENDEQVEGRHYTNTHELTDSLLESIFEQYL